MSVTLILANNLESEMHKFSDVVAATEELAEQIADKARELAPVETGAYRDGIIVQKVNKNGVARVLATDQKSSWVEFGTTQGMEGHFTMRTAVDALGLKFRKRT